MQPPDKILHKHLAILGINGSGKTYTAKGLAERLLDSGRRICVIDPTGRLVWPEIQFQRQERRLSCCHIWRPACGRVCGGAIVGHGAAA
jgi:adenylylsulfate kinase-like enzyme